MPPRWLGVIVLCGVGVSIRMAARNCGSLPVVPHPAEHLNPTEPLPDEEAERLAERMAAFGTASRLKLLFALAAGERSVDDLAQLARLTPNAVSQQLRVLRHLRMVVARREGRSVRYRLHDTHIRDLLTAIRHQAEHAEHEWVDTPALGAAATDARS